MTIITAEQLDHIDKVAQSSGVFLGFLGGFVKAVTSSHGIFDALGKMVVGSIVAWLSAPFAHAHFPEEISPMVVFLFGYGGTELVTFLQEIFKNVIGAKLEALLNKITGADLRDSLSAPAKGIHGTSMDAPSAVSISEQGLGARDQPVANGSSGQGEFHELTPDPCSLTPAKTDAMGFPRKEKKYGYVKQ